MHTVRPAIAVEAFGHRTARTFPGRAARLDPRRFGRGIQRDLPAAASASGLSDDFKLFATTFLAGFLFISILLA